MILLSASSALDRLLRRTRLRLPLDAKARYVLFSDLHRGTGDRADDFRVNRRLFEAALTYYNRRRFTYIEIGDGDELIENGGLALIVRTYGRVFRLLERFHADGRLIYLVGNHNLQMNSLRWRNRQLAEARKRLPGLWEDLTVRESVLLGDRMLLFHGHQVDALSTFLFPLSRLFIRFFWRSLQSTLGLKNRLSVSQNPKRRFRFERTIASWAEKRRLAAVTGHTHRPVFPAPGRPHYLNPGSGVIPRTVTALEIEADKIRMAEWRYAPAPAGRVRGAIGRYVPRGCRADLQNLLSSLAQNC
ncbi:MAG: metallophosphoesterase family protein [Candidatus Aminicenantes bacterium]|nr:metallophosphoesterase family protein [Candidatus Aminicenantes bacterium]